MASTMMPATLMGSEVFAKPGGIVCGVTEGQLIGKTTGPMAQPWASWREETAQKIEESVAKVQREPGPDPYKEDCVRAGLETFK